MSNLYKNNDELCSVKKISGYRLCKDIGMSPNVITELRMGRRDAGKNPSWSTIANTVAVCGASIDELVGITGPAQHPDAADAHHIAYVEDMHRGCRKERQKWQRLSFILMAVIAALALLIAGVAVYDLLHPSAGWFQYVKQVAEGYIEQTAAFSGIL